MTSSCDMLSAAFEELRADFACTPSADPRTLLVTTGRFYGDGDPVEVVVRFSEDGARVAVSDGGVTRARREVLGAHDLAGNAKTLWHDVLAEFGVAEIDDRIYGRGLATAAAQLIGQIADASLALDSVKLLAEPNRVTFTSRLEDWLRNDAGLHVLADKVVANKYGEPQQVTAVVHEGDRRVAIQGAGGQNASAQRSSAEHAHWVFSGLDETIWPIESRLVILERTRTDRTKRIQVASPLVSRLTEVAYVGSFDAQITLRRFLTEQAPSERDLVQLTYGQFGLDIAVDSD